MPAVIEVLIWNFGGARRLSHFGHAAVRLKNIHGIPEHEVYISWWPSGTGKTPASKRGRVVGRTYEDDLIAELSPRARTALATGGQARTGQVQIRYSSQQPMTLEVDGKNVQVNKNDQVWVRKPDHVLKVPAQAQDGNYWGLDAVRMYEWWLVFSNSPSTHYRADSTTGNCAAVALTALTAGGAEKLWRPPTALAFLDPNQVRDFVRELNLRIKNLNFVTAELKKRGQQFRDKPLGLRSREASPVGNTEELPTFQEWHTMSERGMKWYDRRKEQVRKIDKLYKVYSALGAWSKTTAPKKLQVLVQMMEQVHDHMLNKPRSDKADAIRWLGRAIIYVYWAKSDQYKVETGDWMQASNQQLAFIA